MKKTGPKVKITGEVLDEIEWIVSRGFTFKAACEHVGFTPQGVRIRRKKSDQESQVSFPTLKKKQENTVAKSNSDRMVEEVTTEDLIPYARNSKLHSEAQVAQIAGSIREFGFCNPVLIDNDNGIIAGHGRVLAAQVLGLPSVPCLRLSHLSRNPSGKTSRIYLSRKP